MRQLSDSGIVAHSRNERYKSQNATEKNADVSNHANAWNAKYPWIRRRIKIYKYNFFIVRVCAELLRIEIEWMKRGMKTENSKQVQTCDYTFW